MAFRILILATLVQCLAVVVQCHAGMYRPQSRNSFGMTLNSPGCQGGSCLWFTQGAHIGCAKATGDVLGCNTPAKPTIRLDSPLITFPGVSSDIPGDPFSFAAHPWRRPGSAPVEDAYGLSGGWYAAGPAGYGGDAPPGSVQGQRGSELPKLLQSTEWTAGGVAEVAFSVFANHGGGKKCLNHTKCWIELACPGRLSVAAMPRRQAPYRGLLPADAPRVHWRHTVDRVWRLRAPGHWPHEPD